MNDNPRNRLLIAALLPLGIIAVIAAITLSLSRVMLAVPETVATITALLIAAYVLLLGGLIAARPAITSRVLGVGMVLGLVAVVTAGLVSAQAGMRDLHAEDVADEAPAGEDDAATDAPADAYTWVSDNMDFTESPETVSAGGAEMALVNDDGIFHDVVIEETGEEILAAEGGEVDVQDVALDPGEYTYYCSVPGHREAGMEGTVTAE